MEQAAMAVGPGPLDESGLCMLSFDGGGVRGLSSLYILDHIMRNLNHQRALTGQPAKKPCEIFDLIGGTSTGGLIAIMLGRLEMDVGECIAAYCKLFESVFKVKKHWSRVTARGKIQPRFDSKKLKAAIETVLKDRNISPTTPFNDRVDRGCKVFVCATSTHSMTTRRLRSYDTIKEPHSDATIVQVAMATSAASTFFEPVTIGDMTYIDGGLGANNPVDEVVGEARYILGHEADQLKPLVKCFISIGTGNPGIKSISDNFLQFISTTLVSLSTNTEATAKRFALAWRDLSQAHRYFRFNVEQGLQDIDLSEYKESGKIKTVTQEYLEHADREDLVEECVKNLKTKQKRTNRDLAEKIQAYNNTVQSAANGPPSSPKYCLPFAKNKRFIGRGTILKKLSNAFFGEEPCERIALTGLGGVGKTQTALQFAFWVQSEKPEYSIFWLSALSASSFEQGCNTVATELSIFEQGQDSKPILKRFLSSKQAGPWLIIVDNADEMGLVFGGDGNHAFNINDQLPDSCDGKILFTTRSNEMALAASDNHIIEIDAMDETEARMFLENSIVRQSALGDGSAVTELLEELTYLPLAIAQAAAYLNRNLVTIGRYLELLRGTEQEVASLLSREFHDRTRYSGSQNAVATTWWVSFNQIVEQDPVAAQLLRFISRIEAKAIPLSMLPRGDSSEQLTYSVGTLCAYTFLVPRDGQDVYDMHSLVHLATRIWVERNGLTDETMTDAYKHLSRVFLMINSERDPGRSQYMPHALKLLHFSSHIEVEERFILSHRVGIWLECDGRPREAIEQHELAFNWAKEHLSEDDPNRFKFEDALASAYRSEERMQKSWNAWQWTLKKLELRPWLAGIGDDGLLEICQGVEKFHSTYGFGNQSTETLQRISGVKDRLHVNPPERKSWQVWITEAYYGRSKDSEERKRVHEELETRFENSMGYWHRLVRQDYLGRLSRDQENKMLVEILENLVQTVQRVAEGSNYLVLACQNQLANAYIDDCQFSKGIELLRQVISGFEAAGGMGYLPLPLSLGELAQAHEKAGELAESVRALTRLGGILVTDFGVINPVVLRFCWWLADIYLKAGQASKALSVQEYAVGVWRAIAENEHPGRLQSEHNLGWVYYMLGQYGKAMELIEHVAEIERKTLPEGDKRRVEEEAFLQAIRNKMEESQKPGKSEVD